MSDAAGELEHTSLIVDELRAANDRLQRQLKREKDRKAQLLDAVYRAARDAAVALGPAPPVPEPPLDRRHGKPLVALVHATDWQVGKRTETYSPEIAAQRIGQL